MRSTLLVVHLFIILSKLIFSEDTNPSLLLVPSPDDKHTITIEGNLSSVCDIILIYPNGSDIILMKQYIRVLPVVKWLNNNLVKVTIDTDSPNYFSFYLLISPLTLSNNIYFTIAENIDRSIVIYSNIDQLSIHSIFDNEVNKNYDIQGLIPGNSCKITNMTNNKFTFTYIDNSQNPSKEKSIIINY